MRSQFLAAALACAPALMSLAVPALGAAAAAQPAGAGLTVPNVDRIETLTLDNGLTIVVWPDFDIPNVALYNWVRAGSRNEAPGITGLAHFFEHMMFNGTSRRQPGEFDRIMEANGGANNAATNDDVTIYMDWFPRTALDVIFNLEADRLQNLAFTPSVIDSERDVVHSERRLRVEDDNAGMLFEQVQSTAFVAHPYQFPTIGWPSDIRSWSVDDLQKFFRTYYAPNNQTMVFAGAVEPEEVFALARKYLAPIPRQAARAPVRTVEPEQLGERRVSIEADAQTPLVQFAYKGLKAADVRTPAAELLMTILTEGDASRLHRTLVEKEKVAIAVQGYLQQGFDPGLFWVFATVPSGADPARTEQTLTRELEVVARDGVTEAELRRARNLFASGFWKKIGTIDGKAELLGAYQTYHGDYRKLFTAPADYEKISVEDVRKVAAEILRRSQRTVGTLVPKAAAAAAAGEG